MDIPLQLLEVVWLNTRIQRFPIPEKKMPKSLKCGRLQRVVLLEQVVVQKNISCNTLTHSVYHAAIHNRSAARFWDSEMEEERGSLQSCSLVQDRKILLHLTRNLSLFCKFRIWDIIWHTIVRFLCCCMDNSSSLPCLAWSVSSQQILLDSSIFSGNPLHYLHGRALFEQFQFSIQATFLSKPDLPIDLLDVAEIAEIQIVDQSPEKRCQNFSFPNVPPQPQPQEAKIPLACSKSSNSHRGSHMLCSK